MNDRTPALSFAIVVAMSIHTGCADAPGAENGLLLIQAADAGVLLTFQGGACKTWPDVMVIALAADDESNVDLQNLTVVLAAATFALQHGTVGAFQPPATAGSIFVHPDGRPGDSYWKALNGTIEESTIDVRCWDA